MDGGRIWYKVSGKSAGTPVVLLHGGPGLSSYYLKSLEALGDERPVVRYDQLGAGKSDRTTDTTLMNIRPRSSRSSRRCGVQLGYDRMHLVGHSWGAQLALAYYQAHPDKVESLVLASPSLDIPAWNRNVARLVGTLSDSARRAIVAYEKGGRADPAAYAAAAAEFYGKYVWRHPVAADLDSLLATANSGDRRLHEGERGVRRRRHARDVRRARRSCTTVTVPVLFTVGRVRRGRSGDGAALRVDDEGGDDWW